MKKQQLLYRFTILCFSAILLFSCKNENPIGKQNPEVFRQIDSLGRLINNAENDSLKLIFNHQIDSISKENQYIEGIMNACNIAGKIYAGKGDFINAKTNLDSALLFSIQLNDSIKIAQNYYELGELYIKRTMLMEAQKSFLDAHFILKTIENSSTQTFEPKELSTQLGNANLGLAKSEEMTHLEDTDEYLSKIEKHLRLAFEYFKAANHTDGIVRTYLTSGMIYYNLDSLEKAEEHYTAAEEISDSTENAFGKAYSLQGLGAINFDLGNYNVAKSYFETAKVQFHKLKRPLEVFDADYNLCYIWLETGEIEKAEIGAIKHLRPIFETEENFESKEHAAFLLADIYYEKTATDTSKSLIDSIIKYKEIRIDNFQASLGETKIKELENLEIRHDIKERKLELKVQKAETRYTANQRNWALIALTLLLALFANFYSRKKAKEKLLVQEMEMQKFELETQKLKLEDQIQKAEVGAANSVIAALEEERKKIARMIHDKLGSTLVTVNRGLKGYLSDAEEAKIEKSMLESYTGNLDEVYTDLRDISHLLDEQADFSLIEKLEKFCRLFTKSGKMKIQFLREGDFSNLDADMRTKLFLFAKELITNVLKYSEAPKVEIQLLRFEKMISLSVIDDGKGFNLERTPLGFGLSKMKIDVESLGGSFLIDSKTGFGTTVMIDIPK